MSEVKVLSPSELNFDLYAQLQREAFADVVGKTGMGYLLAAPYYRWKYAGPFGPAKIAAVFDAGKMVAVNAMYPLEIATPHGPLLGFQSCDTATLPEARGKGYFLKCLAALKATLPNDTVFFGFPNRNSAPGFLKFGWTKNSDVHTWVRVLPAIGRRQSLQKLATFTAEHTAFFTALRRGAQLHRTADYMNWRYFQHPLHTYEVFEQRGAGHQIVGVLVTRRFELNGKQLRVAMETLAKNPTVERQLLAAAAGLSTEDHTPWTLAMNNTTAWPTALGAGFFRVPARLLPKQQILMGAAQGPHAQALWEKPWQVQIGDWDGF